MKKIWALLLVLALCIGCMGSLSVAAAEEYTFPLAEPVTLTAWRVAATSDPKLGIVTFNDIEAVQAWEKATNVHIEWINPPSGTEQENFNLMIASGDYPDIIFDIGTYYVGGLDKAIADDVIIPLNGYMDNLLSDYNALISRNETVYKDCKTDEGNFPAVYFINTPDQGPWYGMGIRQDWLDKLGLEAPVTYDDWHTVLTAFKENFGCKSPLWLNYHAGDVFSVFAGGYGVSVLGASGNGFINVDGTVKFSPMEEGYKEYVSMLRDWYAEGLIDPDYYSNTTATYIPPDELWATGNAGAWPEIYTLFDTRPYMGVDENNADIDVVPIAAPVKNAGDQVHLYQYNFTRGTGAAAITTACKNPDLAAAYLNLGSQQEWAWLAYYGVEGDTYTVVDGKPVYTDKILNNPDGLSANDAMTKFCFRSAGMYIWDRELQTAGPKALAAINDVWPSNQGECYMIPNITMTSEEANRYSTLMGDISTFVEENTTKFILGSKDMAEWDDFINSLKSMGVEEAISLQQAALDRFNAR